MKRLVIALILVVAIGFGSLAFQQSKAQAAYCTPGGFGVAGCHGYFSGALARCTPSPSGCVYSGPGNILSGGLFANNATDMINIVWANLNSGSVQNQRGAAFIIDTMLGHQTFQSSGSFGAGINYAYTNWGTWVNLVNYYGNSTNPGWYGVRWSVAGGDTRNSQYFASIQDDGFHTATAFTDDQGNFVPINAPVIEFYWNGGANTFKIERDCANLEGELAIPPINNRPVGNLNISCDPATGAETATFSFSDPDGATWGHISTGSWSSGDVGSGGPYTSTIPPGTFNPYVAQPVYLWVWDSGQAGSAYGGGPTVIKDTVAPCVVLSCGSLNVTPNRVDPYMRFGMTVNVNNSAGSPPPGANMSLKITPPAGASYTFNGSQVASGGGGTSSATFNNLGPTNKTGVYDVSWTLTAPSVSKTCNSTLRVTYMPYLNIYGGDVMTGASAEYGGGSSSCVSSNNAAGIASWNNYTGGFSGGGTQYGARALDQILGFATAQNSSSAPGTSLSFANQFNPPDAGKLNPAADLFGGYFGAAAADCDFTSDLTGAPQAGAGVNPPASVAGSVTIYATGNVYINHNVIYSGSGSWSSPSQIPKLVLVVVGGNIYIDSNVTQLDGLYVAEPDGVTGGVIYTCASGLGVPVSPTSAGFYARCNRQLVINGAFVAKQVQFGRTAGSLGQATTGDTVTSNHAAEVFNYSPELWLPRGGSNPNSGYTAITALPPTL